MRSVFRWVTGAALACSACESAEPAATGDDGDTTAPATTDATSVGTTAPGTSGAATTSAGSATTGATGTTGSVVPPPPGATEENLRVAFFGDHGLGFLSAQTLQLVRDEEAAFLVVLGDFDYDDSPAQWDQQLDDGLGPDFPVFAAAGNHDIAAWPGYRDVLQRRFDAIDGAQCEDELGVQSSCHYRGLHFILSGVGTMDAQSGEDHDDYLERKLADEPSIWSICAWHKNQNDMQAGGKGDEVGWEAYRTCMDGGGIIATGHEHSYARTLTLRDLGNEAQGHGAGGDPGVMEVGLGKTFVFVAGLGGVGIRDYHANEHDDDTWWSTIYTSDLYMRNTEVQPNTLGVSGVLFVDFYVDGDPYKARAYFKNVLGEVLDEFEIHADP